MHDVSNEQGDGSSLQPESIDQPDGGRSSPIMQTVMLASGMMGDEPETAGSFMSDKGESVHFVVLPGHQCPHCTTFFQSNSAMTGSS